MAECDVFSFSVYFIFTCLLLNGGFVMGQGQEETGYGSGALVLTVFLTIIIGVLFEIFLYYLWKKYWKARKGKHLILETDPERGKGEFAFDNPGFKDAGLSPLGKSLEKLDKPKSEFGSKTKWNQWSPLSILSTKSEKKRTQDDSALEDSVKVVSLRSQDFTGLGFNICGNMKDGIFIKDVLHHGPAFESRNLNSGDRINSITISFEHIVYEDALAILSYASPYDIIISAKSGKIHNYPGQYGRIVHPILRSSSSADLVQMEKSARKSLFQPDESSEIGSNYSSLQKTRSNVPTLERGKSKSPKPDPKLSKPKAKPPPETLKRTEEVNDMTKLKIEAETQKSENKYQKFGVLVLPNPENLSPKLAEQNENNINIERTDVVIPIICIDEVDKKQAPPVKRREKINKPPEDKPEPLERQSLLNSSGIKRDENNIPLEIPNDMLNAALMAKKNRKSVEEEEIKATKKMKGKAPRPPELEVNNKDPTYEDDEEIYPAQEINDVGLMSKLNKSDDSIEKMKPDLSDIKDYNSDSDIEGDNQSSVNTIELNASDITVHQSEENEEKQNSRKTASTGDLTKIQKTRKTSTGTLERAQSLDITDTGMPVLAKKRKAAKLDDGIDSKTSSDESLYGSALINKEPRLSLILDGLNTCQRSRLKKSTEWGNLEDAILNLNKQDGSSESFDRQNSSFEDFKMSNENLTKNFNFGAKSPEFDALVNKINEIKQETIEIINEQEREIGKEELEVTKEEIIEIIEDVPITMQNMSETIENMPKSIEIVTIEKRDVVLNGEIQKGKVKNEIWPLDITTDKIQVINEVSDDFKSSEVIKVENKIPNVIKLEAIKKPAVNTDLINDFILNEREASCKYDFPIKHDDTNISDDIKVSRHSMGSLERPKFEDHENISNIIISDKDIITPSFEISFNNKTTNTVLKDYDLNKQETIRNIKNYDNVIVSTPDLIKNITIAEAIHDLNNEVTIEGPTSLTFEIPSITNKIEPITINSDEFKTHNGIQFRTNGDINKFEVPADTDKTSSLTYITEIQVLTAKNGDKNISEIEIDNKNLDNDFENYIKNFESNIQNFENNIHNFEQSIQEVAQNVKKEEPKENNYVLMDTTDPEKELQKVQEIVEEQLKKLPEMRFTTSSYESQIKQPEKRQSQIEILRSNFEKNSTPNRMARSEISPPKSRIPVLNKTPPTSPERRDSRILDTEPDKDILEIMSSHIPKPANRNVTVTSIRSSSKIPSGLPMLRPPVPPRKIEGDDNHVSKISTNGNVESSFRQWVFNPHDTNTITNITVTETKYDHK